MEKVVENQLEHHLEQNKFHDIGNFQSAYRRYLSTESSLLQVHNIIESLDRNPATMLVPLDLSTAFEIIYHDILLDILQQSLSVGHSALDWISSYLCDRTHTVKIEQSTLKKNTPNPTPNFSVPQGCLLDL